MSIRHVVTALACAASSALAVGCGGSSSPTSAPPPSASPTPAQLSAAAFRSALRGVATQEDAAQHKVEAAMQSHTVAQLEAALAAFAADQRNVAAQLATLRPPSDAAAANTELSHAFSDNAAAIGALLSKLRTATTVRQALRVIQADHQAQQVGQEIDAALGKLKQLGYASGS